MIIIDPAPDSGLPAEARAFRSKRPDSATRESLVLHDDSDIVRVRYFSLTAFKSKALVRAHHERLFSLKTGSTTSFPHWAEVLGVPEIEAFTYKSMMPQVSRGHLLVWPGRAVYQDREGNWWFTSF